MRLQEQRSGSLLYKRTLCVAPENNTTFSVGLLCTLLTKTRVCLKVCVCVSGQIETLGVAPNLTTINEHCVPHPERRDKEQH